MYLAAESYLFRMTTSERKSRKIYYTMGEVSEMFDVNPSLIRFWEQKFDILKPDKNKKGNRLFTPKDVENLKLIYHLVKEKGMTLKGAQMESAAIWRSSRSCSGSARCCWTCARC